MANINKTSKIQTCIPARDQLAYQEILALRKKVFVEEQSIAPEIEHDGYDPKAIHLFISDNKKIISCVRLYSKNIAELRLGRLCTIPEYRKKGYGKILMEAGVSFAKKEGFTKIAISAQSYLKNYYENFGFKVIGDTYQEAGIDHIAMELTLNNLNSVQSQKLQFPFSSEQSKELRYNSLKVRISYELVNFLLERNYITEEQRFEFENLATLSLGIPKDQKHGDYAFGCFQIAKKLNFNPVELANKLASEANFKFAKAIQNVGPYVNFHISNKIIEEEILAPIISKDYFSRSIVFMPPKIMFEFSQPNTHKELHVGHMRNICLGNALSNICKYVGLPTVKTTFPGDVGTHVAKCLWYLKNHNTENVPAKNKGEWLGKIYTKANNKIEDEGETEQAKDTASILTTILQQLEKKQGEYYDLWQQTREWSIAQMQQTYDWTNTTFEHWYWESEVDSDSVQYVKELQARGKLIVSDGAIGMDLSDDNLGFCMLLKSDGNGMYSTKDLYLAIKKFADFKLDKSIYLVDLRQAYHFQQVFKVLEKIGFPHAKDCYHLPYNFVELPDGAMSSRKGNIVPVSELIDGMKTYIKINFLQRYKGDWQEEEISLVADQIAQGAIKYSMNKFEPASKIVFNLEEWLRLDGESGPYIQYTATRINSLQKKAKDQGLIAKFDETKLTEDEKAILLKLNDFNQIAYSISYTFKTNHLCAYLYELAKMFNSYYTNNKIITEDKELSSHRLMFCNSVLEITSKGLELLGIPKPERM